MNDLDAEISTLEEKLGQGMAGQGGDDVRAAGGKIRLNHDWKDYGISMISRARSRSSSQSGKSWSDRDL